MHRTEYSSLRQGLVGAWCPSLGASGLSLIDRSGRNNHGTLTNMAGQDNWQASGSGVALNFDGTNDYGSLGDASKFSFERTDSFTISAWVNPNVVSGVAYGIVDKSDINNPARGWALVLFRRSSLTATAVSFFATSTSATNGIEVSSPASSIVAAVWQHIAVAYAGTSSASGVDIFINGVRQAQTITTDNLSATIRNSSVSPIIGSRANGTGQRFPGQADDIRIYNRALTPAEIRLLASRRGIGLTPLPDRAAGLPRRFSVNVGGDWRPADSYVNVGGAWRLSQPSVNVGGVWK